MSTFWDRTEQGEESEIQTSTSNPYLAGRENPLSSATDPFAQYRGAREEMVERERSDRVGFWDRAEETTPQEPAFVDDSASAQIGAGIDLGQGLLWEGAGVAAELMGYRDSDFHKYVSEQADKNFAEANAVPALTLADQVFRGVGTVGAAFVPSVAAAAGSALLGAPAAGIAATAGAITGVGMNLGDLRMKQDELDPESDIRGGDAAIAGAMGLIEMVPVARVAKALKFAEKPMIDSLKKVAWEGAKGTAFSGVTEGLQDATNNVLAYRATGTPISDEVVANIVEQAKAEALVGAIIGGPMVTAGHTAAYIQNQAPNNVTIDEETGEIVINQLIDQPKEIGKNPGMFKSGVARLFGRAHDLSALKFGAYDEDGVFSKMAMNPTERKKEAMRAQAEGRAPRQSLDALEHLKKADLRNSAEGFFSLKAEEQDAIVAAKANKQPAPEGLEAGMAALHQLEEQVTQMAAKSGLSDFVNWRGEDFVPLLNVNSEEIISNPNQFKQDMMASLDIAAMEEKEINRAQVALNKYVENVVANGRYVYGHGNTKAIVDRIQNAYKSVIEAPTAKAAHKRRKKMNKIIRGAGSISRKDNALEQERYLKMFPEAGWTKYRKAGTSGQNYEAYIESMANRLAIAEQFGSENDVYWAGVSKMVSRAIDEGVEVTAEDLNRFVDLINVAQKLPTKQIGQGAKTVMNNIRAFQNVTKLPMALIPSLAEIVFVGGKYGYGSTFSTAFKRLMSASAAQVNPEAYAMAKDSDLMYHLNLNMHEATSHAVQRIEAGHGMDVKKWETRFFKVTGLPQFTMFLKQVATLQAESSLKEQANILRGLKKGNAQQAVDLIYEAGLEPNQFLQWAQSWDYSSDYFKNTVRPALLELADDVVVHPSSVRKPMWMANPYLMLVGQLKGFATVFTNGIMRTWYDRVTQGSTDQRVKALAQGIIPTVSMFIAAQLFLGLLRAQLRDPEEAEMPDGGEEWWEAIIHGLGYLGMPGYMLEASRAFVFGGSPVESIGGAAVSDMSKLTRDFGMAFTDPEKAMDMLVKDLVKIGVPSVPMAGPLIEEPVIKLLEEAYK